MIPFVVSSKVLSVVLLILVPPLVTINLFVYIIYYWWICVEPLTSAKPSNVCLVPNLFKPKEIVNNLSDVGLAPAVLFLIFFVRC